MKLPSSALRPQAKGLRWVFILLLCLLPFGGEAVAQQDSIPTDTINLPTIYVSAHRRTRPLTPEERRAYWRRVRDVKKVLPYAKYIAHTLIETYEYMETLPEDEQDKHLDRVIKDLKKEMEPKMRDLTLGQGKLLIKLINRQCGSSSYELVKALLGGFRAWWWNAFAGMMGASLKAEYRPQSDPDDAVTERIIELYEHRML